jgi:hypothetical protein
MLRQKNCWVIGSYSFLPTPEKPMLEIAHFEDKHLSGKKDFPSFWHLLLAPVKTHTLTGPCRTVEREKTLVKDIVHHVFGMVRFPRNFL